MNNYIEKNKQKHKLYKETLELVGDIYNKYPAGGCLHIVLDDGNIEDGHIKFCIDEIMKLEDGRNKEIFLVCANNLMKMTKTQRLKVYRNKYERLIK